MKPMRKSDCLRDIRELEGWKKAIIWPQTALEFRSVVLGKGKESPSNVGEVAVKFDGPRPQSKHYAALLAAAKELEAK